jgi:hypothetical protein
MFLKPDEITDLTGRQRSDAQCRVLTFMGIEHKQRPDGSVAVLRAHVEKAFGDGVVLKTRRKTAPDFSMVT